MELKNQFKILWKSSGLAPLLIMGTLYGLFFGSITQISVVVVGEISVMTYILQFLSTTLIYTSLFLLIIVIVIIASHIKTYISLGMDRRSVLTIWRVVVVFVSGYIAISCLIIFSIVTTMFEDIIPRRVLNLAIPFANIGDYFKLFGVLLCISIFLVMIFSLIGNVGNKFGGLICASLCIFLVGCFLFALPGLRNTINWGDHLLLIIGGLSLADGILYWVNKKMIIQTEVMG